MHGFKILFISIITATMCCFSSCDQNGKESAVENVIIIDNLIKAMEEEIKITEEKVKDCKYVYYYLDALDKMKSTFFESNKFRDSILPLIKDSTINSTIFFGIGYSHGGDNYPGISLYLQISDYFAIYYSIEKYETNNEKEKIEVLKLGSHPFVLGDSFERPGYCVVDTSIRTGSQSYNDQYYNLQIIYGTGTDKVIMSNFIHSSEYDLPIKPI